LRSESSKLPNTHGPTTTNYFVVTHVFDR
jgi:hypothetical protein